MGTGYTGQLLIEMRIKMTSEYYQAKKIFIATPGDLMPERRALVDVVTQVNMIKAHPVGFHFEILGWENTLPGNGRPQSLINEEIKKCDLFIMVLWEHWGTPSGRYSSGTEEEFYEAKSLYQSTGKPECWLFFKFSNRAAPEITQFRKDREKTRDVYYHCFNTTTEWMDLLRQFLCKWIDCLDPSSNISNKLTNSSEKSSNEILYRISYQDWIGSSRKIDPIIYFTIEDENSLNNWKQLHRKGKKEFIYNRLSENLGLILGANPYLAQLRYRLSEGQFILLATISRRYEDTLGSSRIFIPNDYSHLCSASENEVSFDGYI